MQEVSQVSNIPKAREKLMDLAPKLPEPFGEQLLNIVYDHLYRAPHIRKGRVKNIGVSPEVKQRIWELAEADPDMHLSEIGEIVGVNQGRVSEVLNGKR